MTKHKCKTWRPGCPAKYAQAKLDGHYTQVVKNTFGQVRVTTSLGTDITELCRELPTMKNLWRRVPPGHSVIGELYLPGRPAALVKSALAGNIPASTLRFTAFAVPTVPHDYDLFNVANLFMHWGVDFPAMCAVGHESPAELLQRLKALDKHKHLEGVVFKSTNMGDWWKWKPVKTIDLVITGFKAGKGKYLGLTGAIEVSTSEGYHVANVSGMDDATRIMISDQEDALLGHVVEIKYQRVDAAGRLRHPRFVQFRDDKLAANCTADQDPDLEESWKIKT